MPLDEFSISKGKGKLNGYSFTIIPLFERAVDIVRKGIFLLLVPPADATKGGT